VREGELASELRSREHPAAFRYEKRVSDFTPPKGTERTYYQKGGLLGVLPYAVVVRLGLPW